jgi:hypothetical protein
MTIVIAVCALVGALAGIAGSAAAPSSKSKSAQAQKKAAKKQARALRHGLRHGLAGGPGFMGGPVHAEAVIPKADGSGFVTVTTDAGTLNSVDGTTVHVKEGTDKKTYKDDVAIDVGSDAKVIRNHADAKLSDLKAGDHVHVIVGGPKGNLVIAEDDAFLAQQKKDFEKGFRHHGFGRGFGPGGPPPGGPGGYPGDKDKSGPNENGSNSAGSSAGGTNS